MKQLPVLILLVMGVLLVGCAQSNQTQETGFAVGKDVANSGRTHQIVIEQGYFTPGSIEIMRGDTIVWTNHDFEEAREDFDRFDERDNNYEERGWVSNRDVGVYHTVSFDNALVDVELAPGESAAHTFVDAGEYFYHDRFNPAAQAVVVVR